MYTIDIASGESKVIHRSNEWLNHLQCSPTDPQQIMFCHEGPWHHVDRVWTDPHRRHGSEARAPADDGHGDRRPRVLRPRRQDGLVRPADAAEHGVLAGRVRPRDRQARTWYHVEREQWSVHYNVSPDGKLFAGDGGGPGSVANLTPLPRDARPAGQRPVDLPVPAGAGDDDRLAGAGGEAGEGRQAASPSGWWTCRSTTTAWSRT